MNRSRKRQALRSQPIAVSRAPTRLCRFLPFRFDETLVGHAHQQGVERARQQSGFFHDVIAMTPFLRLLREGIEELEHLLGWASNSNHAPNTTYVDLRVNGVWAATISKVTVRAVVLCRCQPCFDWFAVFQLSY